MRIHLFLILPLFFLLIFGSPSLALDLAHWDEKRVRSNSSTIWMLLSGKCSNVSNPAKKPRCDEQIRKWQNHREGNKEGKEKPVQVISQEKGGMFKVVHNPDTFCLNVWKQSFQSVFQIHDRKARPHSAFLGRSSGHGGFATGRS